MEYQEIIFLIKFRRNAKNNQNPVKIIPCTARKKNLCNFFKAFFIHLNIFLFIKEVYKDRRK